MRLYTYGVEKALFRGFYHDTPVPCLHCVAGPGMHSSTNELELLNIRQFLPCAQSHRPLLPKCDAVQCDTL